MFQVGGRVVYGIHGVCDITDVEEQMVDRKRVSYLVLEPLGQAGARFLVPTHNAAAMAKLQKILTRQELEQMLSSAAIRENQWIPDENQRKQTYRELISSGDRHRLMSMLHTLYCHKKEQAASGRKMHLCDDNFLRDAEKLLASEICVVMNLEPDQAKQFVRTRLSE